MNVSVADEGFCSAPSNSDSYSNSGHMYWKVTNPTLAPSHLEEPRLVQGNFLGFGFCS
uniref:Uncharacterized protein n=1 Tax=Vitis vinifera TaxID=29760 RepID=F6I787_VITVI